MRVVPFSVIFEETRLTKTLGVSLKDNQWQKLYNGQELNQQLNSPDCQGLCFFSKGSGIDKKKTKLIFYLVSFIQKM